MKILGVIPARYNSSRFPGKPLADILGKPMIWWVYERAKKAKNLDELVVATDDERIVKVCDSFEIPSVMTKEHESAISRVHELSLQKEADLYIQINGDEPLINHKSIELISSIKIDTKKELALNLISKIKNPVEVLDNSNIKVVFDKFKNILYMSRFALPCPYKTLNFSYYKHVGILGFTKSMLEFFAHSKPLFYEKIEGLETLRFIEYKKSFICRIDPLYKGLSVDTLKDLQVVCELLSKAKK
ncbi:3-deoxy-manno-octulosonate cytidylyltransferase [Campylobacter avium]|uniref:3-deoxy-manno-octulosonate cytidylyltransferase n=1 Tax=Campylobacter avium TaxID=522485 RepID=UPI002354ED8F|nr:3-deoxy-manno-octulosonate cytidylyltransferase [Campylobacter avium]